MTYAARDGKSEHDVLLASDERTLVLFSLTSFVVERPPRLVTSCYDRQTSESKLTWLPSAPGESLYVYWLAPSAEDSPVIEAPADRANFSNQKHDRWDTGQHCIEKPVCITINRCRRISHEFPECASNASMSRGYLQCGAFFSVSLTEKQQLES